MEEIYLPYPLNPNYYVSNFGNVKNKNGQLKSQNCGANGYLFVGLYEKGKGKRTHLVHRMVLITFNFIEDYKHMEVDHLDGNRQNNNLNNLQWVEYKTNYLRMNENRKEMNKELTRIVNIYGYEKTLKILKNIT
jgi:hypothetical protein